VKRQLPRTGERGGVQAKYGYIHSASGGVEINSWAEASHSETSNELAPLRDQANDARGDRWWWN
jgi:hypothetical protein